MGKYLKCQTIESFDDVKDNKSEERQKKMFIPGIKNKHLFIGVGVFALIVIYFMMSKKAPKVDE